MECEDMQLQQMKLCCKGNGQHCGNANENVSGAHGLPLEAGNCASGKTKDSSGQSSVASNEWNVMPEHMDGLGELTETEDTMDPSEELVTVPVEPYVENGGYECPPMSWRYTLARR